MSEPMVEELKNKVESLLFSAGKKIELAEIAKLCNLSHRVDLVEKALKELKGKYSEGPIMLVQEGTSWKMTIREKYASIVQKIVTQTELSKTLMETLAVIAYKAPVLQSSVIKIRTNKAYDHLSELEKQGYITREKHGRTKMIRLSPKFFDYFDIPPEKVKERFKQIDQMEKAVEIKEAEAKELKHEAKEKKTEHRKKSDEEKKKSDEELKKVESEIIEKEDKLPEIDLVDKEGHKEKLEVYKSEIAEGTEFEEPKANIQVVKEQLGELEVVREGLTDEEKQAIVSEAERLRKEDLALVKKKEGAKTEEKEFKDKYSIFKKEEEVPEKEEAPGEEEEVPEEEEAPAEEEEPSEAPVPEGKEKPESPAKAAPEIPEPEEKKGPATAADIVSEAKAAAGKKPIKLKEGKRLFHKGIPKEIVSKIDARVEEIVYGTKPPAPEEEEKKEEEGKKGTKEDY